MRSEPVSPRPPIEEERVRAAGIRRLEGQHLTLYTDIREDPEVDALCAVFDQAYPQWNRYFQVQDDPAVQWHMIGCLMRDKERFMQAGLWDDSLPAFRYGYSTARGFWLYEQPSAYYRRHLMLHEGTHCFCITRLAAPTLPWYHEGVAELLGTHLWVDGHLTLGHFPRTRDEVPEWGRIKLVREAYADRRGLLVEDVLAYGPTAHLDVEPYAWCWALAALLDGNPRYRDRFRELPRHVGQADFRDRFLDAFQDDRAELDDDWQVFVADLEYGYDLERAAIDFAAGEPLPARGAKAQVASDRGWQSSRLLVEAGKKYRITARGRYHVAQDPKPWLSEPGGVSIRYYKGLPLGMLRSAVRPARAIGRAASPFLAPIEVGLETTLIPTETGTLYLRINDSAAELADNAGSLEVEVELLDEQ
jgi:hypothetical protein